jgi:hypothetical protein
MTGGSITVSSCLGAGNIFAIALVLIGSHMPPMSRFDPNAHLRNSHLQSGAA